MRGRRGRGPALRDARRAGSSGLIGGGSLVRGILLAAVLALAAAPLAAAAEAAAAPSVEVLLPPGSHTVGDRVAVELRVLVPGGGSGSESAPRFPVWKGTWGEAEIVEAGEPAAVAPPPTAPAGTVAWSQRLVLAGFRPGRLALPPREIVVPAAGGRSRRLTTPDALALTIDSVLPAAGSEGADAGDDSGDAAAIPPPKPEKSLVPLPVGARFWWTAAILGLALAAVLAVLWRRRRQAGAEAQRPLLPPADELRGALAAARAAGDPAAGLVRVSLALRRYLGRRLGFPAAESTTTEVRRQLAGRHLPGGVAARCAELLAACDLVKFARRPAAGSDVERWCTVAGEVAERVEEHLRPAEDAAAAEAAPSIDRRQGRAA